MTGDAYSKITMRERESSKRIRHTERERERWTVTCTKRSI